MKEEDMTVDIREDKDWVLLFWSSLSSFSWPSVFIFVGLLIFVLAVSAALREAWKRSIANGIDDPLNNNKATILFCNVDFGNDDDDNDEELRDAVVAGVDVNEKDGDKDGLREEG